MRGVVWLHAVILLIFGVLVLSSPAGKVLHAKSTGAGSHGYEDKRTSGRSISKRSIDLRESKSRTGDLHLNDDVVPIAYHLELQPFPSEGHFTGRVQINMTCNEPTSTITLHAHENLHIAHSEVTVKLLGAKPSASKPKDPNIKADYPFNHKGYGSSPTTPVSLTVSSTKKEPAKQWYVITLAEKLKKNTIYQLELSFSGSLGTDSTDGFFRSSYQLHRTKEERWFAATKMSLNSARRVFPCFDEPHFKATFEISVAQAGRMTALSNMPVRASEEMLNETGWSWVHFQESPAMSTYSVGVAVLDLESISVSTSDSSGGISMSVFARPSFLSEVQGVIEEASSIIEHMENYLGEKFPLPKLDLVALPHFSEPQPADHWGLIFLRESYFLNNETLRWVLANEVAHQWFGHLVTPNWWTDANINEGITNYLASLPGKSSWNYETSYSLYYEYGKRHPYAGLASQVQSVHIKKIHWLLRMMNYTLGADTFQSGIKQVVQEKKFKTFTEKYFLETLTTQARNDKVLESPITLQQIFNSWINKERYPVITVTRDYQDNSASVEQHVFLRERPQDMRERDHMLWWVPIVYLTPDNLDPGVHSEPLLWMKEERHSSMINLPEPDSFIIVNPNEIGMFLVNYDQHNWELLSQHLRGSGPQIPSGTRAKLVHDAWNLAYSGELDIRTALNLTLFLEKENGLKVWTVVFNMINHLGGRVDGTDAGLKFEEYSRFLLTRLTDSLGDPNPDECKKKIKLRSLAETLLCQLGHQPCLEKSRAIYAKWMELEDPDEGNPVPDSDLCTVFKWGTMEEWEFGLQRLIHFPSTRKQAERSYLLGSLAGCPRQEEKVERLLNITILEGNGNFTDTDIRHIFNMLPSGATGYTTLFNFLSKNWDEIKQRLSGKAHMWEYLVHSATGSFNTQEGLNMVSELYVTRQGEFGTAEPIVEQALRKINSEAQWSDQNLPAMETWLQNHLPEDSETSTVYA